jgi:predicted porin
MWPLLLFDLSATPPAATTPAEAPAIAPKTAPAAPPWLREVTQRVDVYGRFDGNVTVTRDSVNVANNASRFGLRVEQMLPGGLTVLGRGEWSISLGQGDTHYNVSENPDTGLGNFDSTKQQALGTRLGYVGMRFGRFGELTFGKQWGVYYDVAIWTDRFMVFGARSTSTYNAGTDGGETGEGRADDALAYRVSLGPLRIGVQAQFMESRSPTVDSVSGSLIAELFSGLRVGATYSRAFLDLSTPVAGYDGGDAEALTGGIGFDGAGFRLAALGTWTHHHELVQGAGASVMYDTLGASVYLARRFWGRVMPYAGFDFAVPRGLDTRFVDGDFGTRDLIGGLRWMFDMDDTHSSAYLEARTGRTRDASGEQAPDVMMVGIRLDYSLQRALGLD